MVCGGSYTSIPPILFIITSRRLILENIKDGSSAVELSYNTSAIPAVQASAPSSQRRTRSVISPLLCPLSLTSTPLLLVVNALRTLVGFHLTSNLGC